MGSPSPDELVVLLFLLMLVAWLEFAHLQSGRESVLLVKSSLWNSLPPQFLFPLYQWFRSSRFPSIPVDSEMCLHFLHLWWEDVAQWWLLLMNTTPSVSCFILVCLVPLSLSGVFGVSCVFLVTGATFWKERAGIPRSEGSCQLGCLGIELRNSFSHVPLQLRHFVCHRVCCSLLETLGASCGFLCYFAIVLWTPPFFSCLLYVFFWPQDLDFPFKLTMLFFCLSSKNALSCLRIQGERVSFFIWMVTVLRRMATKGLTTFFPIHCH